MREIVVKVPDEQYSFLMKLLRNLSFVKAEPVKQAKPKKMTPEQQEWVDGMREALHEVELHQQGKIQLKSARQLLDEL